MIRVPRWVAAAVVGGTALGVTACGTSVTPTAGGQVLGEAPPPANIGSPLYPAAKSTVIEPTTPRPDPVVIPSAVVQFAEKVQIPAQVDGTIELIASPVTGPVDPADSSIVYHPRDTKKEQPYRRLRENDTVKLGQTLCRLDEQLVARQIEVSEVMIKANDKAIAASSKALTSYEKVLDLNQKLVDRGSGSLAELENLRATVSRLVESVVQAEKEKAKSEGELLQAQTQMARYFTRSPVNGKIVKLLKYPGEFAKAGDTILEIQSTDKVRIEGKVPSEYASYLKKDTPAVIEPTVPVGPAPFANLHRRDVSAVAVTAHPGRPLIVSGGLDSSALVWDVYGTKQSHRLPHPTDVRSVACTPAGAKGGHWVATGAEDGKVRLWDLTNPDKLPKEPVTLDDTHSAAVTAAAYSPDGQFLATAAGREGYVWDVAGRKKKYALPPEHRDAVTAVRFTPQTKLVTVARDRAIRVWHLGDAGANLADLVLDHRSGAVDVLGVSADGSRVLFDKDDSHLDIVSLADGRTLGSVQNPGGNTRFTGLALFSPNGQFVLTAGGDADVKGELQLWDAPKVGGRASERRRLVVPGRSAVTCAAFSPDEAKPFMVVGTQAGGVYYWVPPSGAERTRQWVGRVESVSPADARSVQVRVVVDNPADGGDALQDRSTAIIIIDPEAAPLPPKAALPPKAPSAIALTGGVGEPGAVVQAVGTSVEPPAGLSTPAAPVTAPPPPSAPVGVGYVPKAAMPVFAPPAAGIAKPSALNTAPASPTPVPQK